jgi:2-polyprenyl-3-methyl-5-hydroxy-6-metoxy-1,4-benzoquinol methylase
MSLDLYAKSEHLLGIEEATEQLHNHYITLLEHYKVTSVLDVGCGRGVLMHRLKKQGFTCKGIDLSKIMVAKAQAEGYDVACGSIADVSGQFDAIVAVFDVLNFIAPQELESFFSDIADHLEAGGIFLADINTLHGFVNVAQGVMVAEDEGLFLSVDAVFESNELHTLFTLFEQKNTTCYHKEQDTIVQYFHPLNRLKKLAGLRLIEKRSLSLYDDADKTLLVFKKEL